jgi:lactoylglutathione lyase
MTIHELNHVAIYVTDVQRSSDFYHRVLKLQPIPRPAFSFPGAWFRLGTNQDLDPWERHLKEVGADFALRKPRPDGASQVFLRDPDGHMIELFTPPA